MLRIRSEEVASSGKRVGRLGWNTLTITVSALYFRVDQGRAECLRLEIIVCVWRKGKGSGFHLGKKARWYGQCVVVGHEGNNLWLSMGSSLIRALPEQVRFATESERLGYVPVKGLRAEIAEAAKVVDKARKHQAQFEDIVGQELPPLDEEPIRPSAKMGEDTDQAQAGSSSASSTQAQPRPAVQEAAKAINESLASQQRTRLREDHEAIAKRLKTNPTENVSTPGTPVPATSTQTKVTPAVPSKDASAPTSTGPLYGL